MGVAAFTVRSIIAKYGKPKINLPKNLRPKFSAQGYKKHVEGIGEEIAQDFLEFVINNIETNRYGFKNEAATIEQKKSGVPWIDTKELVDALQRTGHVVHFKTGKHKDSGVSYEDLAMILEYGAKDKGIPPRDVFRRSWRDFRKDAEKTFQLMARPYYENL